MPPNLARRKPHAHPAGKLLLVLLSTIFALAIGEVSLRVLGTAPNVKSIELTSDECVYKRSTNPVLGFELKANYRNESPDFIESYERTNAHGLRDVQRAVEKRNGTRRVILLGDSVVEGYGLPEQQTIPSQLASLIAGENIEVLNFGVSAYCTLAEIELLETKGIQFSPDVVVLVFVENDFDNFNREAFPLGSPIDRPASVEWGFRNSHIFRLSCLQWDWFHFRSQTNPVRWNQAAIGENNVAVGLARFRQLAMEHEFLPVVAIWPRFLDEGISDMHYVPDSDRLIIEALAAMQGIPSFRLSKRFQQEMASIQGSPRIVFSQGDQLHPSAEGARVAAVAIRDILQSDTLSKWPAVQPEPQLPEQQVFNAIQELKQDQPNYARVYTRLGNDYLKRDEFDQAIEQYQRALAEDPHHAAAYNNLGIALERAGKQGAVEQYKSAIRSNPNFVEAHFNLGNSLKQTDRSAAEQHFIRAVQLQPDFVKAHFQLSKLLLAGGRKQAAEAGLRQVLKLDQDHADAVLLLAGELTQQQRLPEARSLFERFLLLRPNHAEALNNLGVVCLALGDRTAAITHFRAAKTADPKHPTAARNLANLLHGESP